MKIDEDIDQIVMIIKEDLVKDLCYEGDLIENFL